MADSVACPECGSPVARGRLSCTSCGTLLAAVAGGPRRTIAEAAGAAAVATEAPPVPTAAAEPVLPASEPATSEPAAHDRKPPRPRAMPGRSIAPVPGEWDEAIPDVGPAPAGSGDRPALAPSAAFAPGGVRPAPSSGPSWPAPRAASSAPAFPPAAPMGPLAPSGDSTPVGPEAPGRSGQPGRTLLDRLPRELPSGMSLVGSALAIASFLLPFATDGVLGTSGIGYFGNWGFGNPGYLLLALAALAVVVVDLFPERSPAWIRTGLLPVIVGAVLLGVAFTYFVRPFGGGTGVTILLVGAIVMLGGGLVGLAVERHGTPPPSV